MAADSKHDRRRLERPAHIPHYAERCLEALVATGLGHTLSVGGGLGLLHYLDYRPTHDVDAWWMPSTSLKEQHRVIAAIEAVLGTEGSVTIRTWGDVTSIELEQEGRVVFAFQVASRSAMLELPVHASWIDIQLDSLPDIVSSKMVALVERGAPRDFRDIYEICRASLTSPEACWELWRRRQQLAQSDTDGQRARLAVQTHMARIEQHRPLTEIADHEKYVEADQVRTWFKGVFLDALTE